MSAHVLQETAPATPRLVRAVVFVACAGVFLVLAYASATTWGDVQRGLTEGFARDIGAVAQASQGGNLHRQLAGLFLGAVGLAMLTSRRCAARLHPSGALGAALAVYLALLVASIGWSAEPEITVRRVVAFLMMAIAALGAARLFPADALVSFALFGSTVYLVVAVVAEVATGAFHPFADGYRLSGIFHPNTVGAFCVMLVTAAAHSDRWRGRPSRRAAVILAGAIVLLLTRSRSALGGLLIAMTFTWMIAARLPRKLFALAAAAWLALAALFLLGDRLVPSVRDAVLMSRSDSRLETLGGRTALWDMLLSYSADRPVLGYGLGGFWSARHVEEIYRAQRWPVAEAHSTYVELLLDAGVVGLAVYVIVLVAALWRAGRSWAGRGDGPHGFMVSLLVYFIVTGTLETLPSPGFVAFLLFWTLSFLGFADANADPSSRCAST
ncbi:MAG TPA: O-antigen ligase family protein [Anaeromyxobacter sp.]